MNDKNQMSIDPNEFRDPYGRVSDLQYWLDQGSAPTDEMDESERAAETLIAAGRCILSGLPMADSFSEANLAKLLPLASGRLAVMSDTACQNLESLIEDWTTIDDVWEADDYCNSILLRRIDFWSVQALLKGFGAKVPPVLQSSLDRQDTALRTNLSVLASVVHSAEFENICNQIAEPFCSPLPWWIGEEFQSAAEFQSSAVSSELNPGLVRLSPQEIWERYIPRIESTHLAALAADDREANPSPNTFEVLKWISPLNPESYATLKIPQQSNDDLEGKVLLLSVYSANIRKKDMQGVSARIGSHVRPFDADGFASFQLCDLRTSVDGSLWIGTDSQPWTLVIE